MRLPVVWTSLARKQLADLSEYISQDSPSAADGQLAQITESAGNLADFPEMGRVGRRQATRELVVPGTPYVVAYRIKLSTIEILAVMHGAQRWPRRFR